MQKYRVLGKKGEGTFSEVLKCQNEKTNEQFACKRMKQTFKSIEQVNNLREIQCMRRLSPHANIVDLKEVIFDKKTGTLALIIELMSQNLYELIRGRKNYLPEKKCQLYIYQTLKALEHMHKNGIFHRDIKPENILVNTKDDIVKLADFGSCRSIFSKQPYTEYISTRWYRAPECLLTDGHYTYKMDIWSIGCVYAEILSLSPLFPGQNELDQIHKIHKVLGTDVVNDFIDKLKKDKTQSKHMDFNFKPQIGTGIAVLVPPASEQAIDLITKQCTYNPDDRPSAKVMLRHSYFKALRDDDKRKARMERVQQQAAASNYTSIQDTSDIPNKRAVKEGISLPVSINKQPNGFLTTTLNPLLGKAGGAAEKKHTLPKIPIAHQPTLNNSNAHKIPHTKKFSTLPNINDDDKSKTLHQQQTHQATKQLGYAQYTLPSLNRLRHGQPH